MRPAGGGAYTAEEVDEIYASAIDKIRCWIREKRSTLPPGSANRALLEELQDLPPEKVFDELLSRSYPNPERVGCPPYRSSDGIGHAHAFARRSLV